MKKSDHAEVMAKLGENIRSSRKQMGFSQDELSKITKLHRSYVSQVERGIRNPTIISLRVLAVGLETEVETLIKDIFVVKEKNTGAVNEVE